MADLPGLRAAIALKVGAVSGIAVSTSSNFGGVADVPAYLVNTVQTITMVNHDSPGIQQRELVFPADLLLAKSGDITDAVTNAETIVEAIYVAALSGVTLGYPTVAYDSWIETSDLGEMTYANQQWFGAKQIWHVLTYEPVNRSS